MLHLFFLKLFFFFKVRVTPAASADGTAADSHVAVDDIAAALDTASADGTLAAAVVAEIPAGQVTVEAVVQNDAIAAETESTSAEVRV